MKQEHLILSNLLKNEEYARRVLSFIQPEYFADTNDRYLFEQITQYYQKYNACPSPTALQVIVDSASLSQHDHDTAILIVKALGEAGSTETQWTLDTTEKWCQDRAVFNALFECIGIIDESDAAKNKQKLSRNAIPDLLRKALSVSLDTNIGHDYLEAIKDRYDYYHNGEERIPFDLDMLNKITNGGAPRKTISVVAAPTGGGKSIFLCHHAAACLRQNLNVLYVTMEMSEERIAERIDANLTNTQLNDLRNLPFMVYEKKFTRATENIRGKLIIKQYPTGTATSLTIRALIEDLKLKKNFMPDVVIVDYLNICASCRYKPGAGVNSYTIVKAIAEELRALAIETNVQLFTATQLNRSGFNNSDVDLTHTSESMGLPATADFFFALIRTEELDGLGQVLFKQLKNRLNDDAVDQKFVMGLDKGRMKFYDLNPAAQATLVHVGNNGKVTPAPFEPTSKFAPGKNEGVAEDPYSNSIFKKFGNR